MGNESGRELGFRVEVVVHELDHLPFAKGNVFVKLKTRSREAYTLKWVCSRVRVQSEERASKRAHALTPPPPPHPTPPL